MHLFREDVSQGWNRSERRTLDPFHFGRFMMSQDRKDPPVSVSLQCLWAKLRNAWPGKTEQHHDVDMPGIRAKISSGDYTLLQSAPGLANHGPATAGH